MKTTRATRHAAVALCLAALGAGPAAAATVTWDGSTDMDWTQPDATSWGASTYTNGDDASFLGSGTGTVTIVGTVNPGSVLVDGTAPYTFAGGTIAGSATLTKRGAGVLTLSGSNTYSGLTIVTSNGVLDVGAIGAGGLSANSGLYLGTTNTGAPSAYGILQGNGTFTRSLSGSATPAAGQIAAKAGGFAARGGDLIVNFGGNTNGISLNSGGHVFGDNFVFGSDTADGKVIVLNPINLNSGGERTFTVIPGIGGDAATAAELRGTLSSSALGGGLRKQGAGMLILSNTNNTYVGKTWIQDGALSVASIRNVNGGNSSLGAPTNSASGTIQMGSGGTTGRLLYTGSGDTTDRAIDLAGTTGGAILEQSGTGLLQFTTNFTATGAGAKTLTLRGSTAGVGEIAGSIVDNSGANKTSVTKDGTGTWILSGANTHGGDTTVSGGRLVAANALAMQNSTVDLQIDGGVAFSNATSFVFGGLAGSGDLGLTNLGGGALTLRAGNNGASTAYSGSLGGDGGLAKIGNGALTLSGSNAYTGPTAIEGGTLVAGSDHALPTASVLHFGSTNRYLPVTTSGALDLNSASATVAGLNVFVNSSATNSIAIGAGRSLQVDGSVFVGANSNTAQTTTILRVDGDGEFRVSGANANFTLGGSTNNSGNAATLDMSGLATFSADLGAGTLRVGDDPTPGAGSGSTLILASNSTIRANVVRTDGGAAFQSQDIRLGAGSNTIHANTITIGMGATGRSNSKMSFQTGTGTLQIRSTNGTGRANMTIGYGSYGTFATTTADVDLDGHDADLSFGNLLIGGRTGGGGGAGTVASLEFDTGTLDASAVIVGDRAGTSGNTGLVRATLDLGGGTVTVGNSGMIVGRNTSTLGANSVSGVVNVAGSAAMTVGATGGTSITLGSSANSGVSAYAALHIGDSATVAVNGDIIRGSGAGAGSVTSILSLAGAGATLDMRGNDITDLTSITFENGTLRDVGAVNAPVTLAGTGQRLFLQDSNGVISGSIGGAAGLSKAGGGRLDLAGANTYAGLTIVSNGTLAVNGSHLGGGQYTVASGATLGGTGLIDAAIAVLSGGAVAPGNSIGALTTSNSFDLDGTLLIELDNGAGPGGLSDLLDVNGLFDLANGVVQFVFTGTMTNDYYIFAEYDTLSGSAFLNALNTPEGYGIDYTFGVGGNQIALVIPEPSTFALLGLGAAVLLGLARRGRGSRKIAG